MSQESENRKAVLIRRMSRLAQRNQDWKDFEEFILDEFNKIQGELTALKISIANEHGEDED